MSANLSIKVDVDIVFKCYMYLIIIIVINDISVVLNWYFSCYPIASFVYVYTTKTY